MRPTAKLVIKPKPQPIVTPAKPVKQAAPAIQIKQVAKPARGPSATVVQKPRFTHKTKVRKSKGVQYVTRQISEESKQKILKLRNVGRGRILVIMGNGPSLGTIDLSPVKANPIVDFFAINKPDMRVWPTTYWGFCDGSQFRSNEDLWNNYDGIIINSTSISKQKEKSLQVKNIGGTAFSQDAVEGICIGRSTVYAMMQMALWMNYDKIYVFGVDMNPAGLGGKLHFYGVNPHVKEDERKRRFKEEAKFYDHAAEVLSSEQRSRFYFCSEHNPWEFPDKFNRLSARDGVNALI